MSVTRFLSLFLALALLVALCCIPCFAFSTYSYVFNWETDGWYNYDSVPDFGNYNYTFTMNALTESYTQTGVCSVIPVSADGLTIPYCSIMINFVVDNLKFDSLFNIIYVYDYAGFNIVESDYTGLDGFYFTLELEKIENPSFVDGVSAGLDGVIGWIQEVTSSLTTGSLLPLLGLMAVAICVTGVLFSVKFIRKTSWGH